MILQRRRHILHCCIYFRVTTLLADSTLPTSHYRPVPHSSGGLFLLTVDIRPRLLGIAFDRSCSQGIANPCLAAVLHDRRLSVSGDTDTSCPVQSIWLLNDSYNRPLFAVCQPDRRRKCNFGNTCKSSSIDKQKFVYFLTAYHIQQDSILDKCILHGLY